MWAMTDTCKGDGITWQLLRCTSQTYTCAHDAFRLMLPYAVCIQEANAINKSLTFLEQTVNALSKKDAHVPFRQSKLTSLLRDALGGNCKTVRAGLLVLCLHPSMLC